MILNSGKTLNFKVSLFFVAISAILIVTLTAISLYAFRQFSISTATEHLRTAAEIARVHLTEAMITDVIDQRQNFLLRLSEVQNLKSARVMRSPLVDEQFGSVRKGEYLPDEIEKKVLQTGEPLFESTENNGEVIFRGTIPYIASVEGSPNCLQCHNAPPGAVLGAVTMTMSITALRHNGLMTVASIVGVVVVAVVVLFALLFFLLRPISNTAGAIEHAVQNAIDGNFTNQLEKKTNDEIGQIASDMNRLLKFLDGGLNQINGYVSQLIVRKPVPGENLLQASIDMVENLTQISQFKSAIEEDDSKIDVYRRLINTLNARFFKNEGEFSIYELSSDGSELQPVLVKGITETPCRWCQKKILAEPKHCRVFHTAHSINGILQPDICYNFKQGEDQEEPDDILIRRQQIARAQIQRRLRSPEREPEAPPEAAQAASPEDSPPVVKRYPLCFPILKSGAVGSIVQLVVKEEDKVRILSALPYIRVYLSDAAPVLEVRRLMETLRESSLRDPMTGLNNRRFLEEFIDSITASVRRKQAHVAIMMLDLDHFKMVNDTYGHDTGDAVLKTVASVIKNSVRASDIVVRYGGEEFLVVLQDTSSQLALKVAEQIRTSVENLSITHGGVVLKKTISIGVADFPGDSATFWQAVKFADVALYHAKETGRNRVMHFTPDLWSDSQGY
ncbi:MAG: diguanylate cyclase [Azoarcus sp.]|jgi:diguanylate cyclase (GGDEF)-like protein|nr:diguanylate cyclase [Azoarcus sp.]